MIRWLSRLNVTTRIMSLAALLVAAMALSLLFLLWKLEGISTSSHQQKLEVEQQNQWLLKEEALLQQQAITQQRLQQAQQVQKSYSDMLFWYFDGSVTQYYESLSKAEESANRLEQQLADLMVDPEAKEQIPPMLKGLEEYRSAMDRAVQYYAQGKANLAGSEINDAHRVVQDMNEQLLNLTQLFQTRLSKANQDVESVLNDILQGGQKIAHHSQQNLASTEHIQTTTLLILIISIPLAASIAIAVILSITRPLSQLQTQLSQIAANNDLTQPLTLTGQDEIRNMADAVQALLSQFRNALKDIDTTANQLKNSANQARSSSEATHEKSSEQQQKSAVIAASATELGASAEDILRTTREGLRLVEGAAEAAQNGQKDVQATASRIRELAVQFDHMENSVSDLAQHSVSISKVLAVIQEIAEQTNLLALNAAIEAARAGDQGRGFAVVADEVRALAQRTSQSTNEVHHLISCLQQQSSMATKALADNRQQLDKGVQLSQQAEASLNAIISEMTTLTDINHGISTISEEQQIAVGSVDEGIQQVQQLAESVEHYAADSRKISQQLDQMAQQLQQQIQHFKH